MGPMLIAVVGCRDVQRRQERVWEMEDHVTDARTARSALARGDLDGVHAAGRLLARPDEVPGLPEEAMPWLAAVRAGGEALSNEPDLSSAADRLVAITSDCAGCHRALAVPVPGPLGDDPLDLAWTALAFESEGSWDAAVAALGSDGTGLAGADSWSARRAALAQQLARPR